MSREPKDPPAIKPRQSRMDTHPEQASNRRRNRHSATEALWRDASPDKLRNVIDLVCSAGCAIQFGYTKDGSTFVVRIVGDGEPYNEFVRPSEDINLYLEGLADDFAK